MSTEAVISAKLKAGLSPDYLVVENESDQHNVPPGSESHFKVVLVSARFADMRRVARHQSVYSLLSEELAGSVHALALHTYSPQEWSLREASAPESPQCLGGSKAEGATD